MADGSVVIDTKLDDGGFKKGLSGLGSLGKTALKGIAVGVGAVATAFAGVVTASVKARGEMEQVAGGTKKIFDQMDYKKIEQDAKEAYKTMNLSATEYLNMMNTVGATFSSTMGDEKGYNTAKKGMQALADYASGTGADINTLNEKYKMITRSSSSYLSIADQFAGLLPQTTDGFLKQAQASGYLSDKYKKLSEVPIDEYQQAITNMLEKGVKDMGLYGNTLAETENTLTGSISAMKASWQNFLSGTGNLTQVVESVKFVAQNILKIVSDAIPDIMNGITESLPAFIELGKELLQNLIGGIVTNLPKLMEGAGQILQALTDGILQLLPQLIPVALQVIQQLAQGLLNNLPKILQVALQIIPQIILGIATMLPTLIPQIVECVITIVETFLDNIDLLIDAGIQLIIALAERTNRCITKTN